MIVLRFAFPLGLLSDSCSTRHHPPRLNPLAIRDHGIGRFLAGSDCDGDVAGEGARTRVTDPIPGAEVCTMEGMPLVGWLPDGSSLAQNGFPATSMLLLDVEGSVIDEIPGYAHPSPDGRFLIQDLISSVEHQRFLLDVMTGRQVPLTSPNTPVWTERSNLYLTDWTS